MRVNNIVFSPWAVEGKPFFRPLVSIVYPTCLGGVSCLIGFGNRLYSGWVRSGGMRIYGEDIVWQCFLGERWFEEMQGEMGYRDLANDL